MKPIKQSYLVIAAYKKKVRSDDFKIFFFLMFSYTNLTTKIFKTV